MDLDARLIGCRTDIRVAYTQLLGKDAGGVTVEAAVGGHLLDLVLYVSLLHAPILADGGTGDANAAPRWSDARCAHPRCVHGRDCGLYSSLN